MINTDLINYLKQLVRADKDIEEGWLPVSTDTRSYEEGAAFIALSGENFNAVDHLKKLKDKNCPIIVYDKTEGNEEKVFEAKKYLDSNFVLVKDAVKFIQELANTQIQHFKRKGGKVISISGSNGKTTTKEMLTHLLSSKFPGKVVNTKKNYNNHIGVPYTIFDLQEDSEFLVLEFGSNAPGEIEVLSKIAEPDFSIVTNIGETHLEFFDNGVKGVFIEESYTYQWIKKKGEKFYLNLDDEFLNTLEVNDKVSTYGQAENAKYFFDIKHDYLSINNEFEIKNSKITGSYNFINMAISLIVASDVSGLQYSDFTEAIESFKPSLLRSEWINKFDTSFFLDAYNANPSSMKHSISAFLEVAKERNISEDKLLFIVGDMNELGNYTGSAHRELQSQLKDLNCIFIGRFSQYFDDSVDTFQNVDEFMKGYSTDRFRDFEMVFIKASRSLQLERILGITY